MNWREEHYKASEEEKSGAEKTKEETQRREGLARQRSELRKEKRNQQKERREKLSAARSTSERRQIKEDFKKIFKAIDTSIEANKKARDNEPQHDKTDDISEGDSEESDVEDLTARGQFAFNIIPSLKKVDKVVVVRGAVYGTNSGPIFPPETDEDLLNATEFDFGNDLFLNITLSGGEVSSCKIETSSDTVGETKAVIYIGSVSTNGDIQNVNSNGLTFTVFSCGENNFVSSFPSYFL